MKRYAVILLLGILLCYSGLESFATNVLDISDGSVAEMLSIPFQQTARYLKEYPEDVTEEEAEAIADVLDYDTLAEVYAPELSNAVKGTYNENGSLKNYFKAWFSMFKKHPGVYFEATLHNTYGYYYLFYDGEPAVTYKFYISTDKLAESGIDVYKIVPDSTSTLTENYSWLWKDVPILGQLMNPAFYTWLLLILAGYLIYKRKLPQLLFLLGPAINILVCIASPVNGYFRYVLPLAACMPALIFWVMQTNKGDDLVID